MVSFYNIEKQLFFLLVIVIFYCRWFFYNYIVKLTELNEHI